MTTGLSLLVIGACLLGVMQCAAAGKALARTPARQYEDRMYLIGVDVGGTFTDIVFADTESSRTLIHKMPTTKDDPSRAVVAGSSALRGLSALRRQPRDHCLHGL